jgi:hypothetical protein
MTLSDYLRRLVRWLASLHAPAGRWSGLAATGLFLVAGVSHQRLVYYLAYLSACVILVLFAADLAKTLIDEGSFPLPPAPKMSWQILVFRVLLTGLLGTGYSFFVWVGVGPWWPPIVWPVIFFVCFFIAWRNLQLWYEQGAEFEQELAEDTGRHASQLPATTNPQARRIGSGQSVCR